MTGSTQYVLALSDVEVGRYRLMAQHARRDEADDWAAAGVVPGAQVADVGCGPGAVAVEPAAVVGPTGCVDAVDRDPLALALAAQVIAGAAAAPVRLSRGTADATGLPAASYDTVMLRHVLAHNGGAEQAIVDHLASLARPGGWVYLRDVDASAFRTLGEDPDLADLDQRYAAFHRELGNDLSVGLRLGSVLRAAGLVEVRHRGWYSILDAPTGMRPRPGPPCPPWPPRVT